MVRRALLSVSDKTGIVEFASFLALHDIEILSTGGTAALLRKHGVPVIEVSDFTGFPEVFGGRVKTLHPRIYGGLLYERENTSHKKEATENNILPIDLVVVNLYPFFETLMKEDVSEEEIIENIDIGGPSMLRAAAKNFANVTAITDPQDYALVQEEMLKNGETSLDLRRSLAAKVFAHVTEYNAVIANYFNPDLGMLSGQKIQSLRYGENPHQNGAFYANPAPFFPSLATAEQLQGKELSFNNILDGNAALSLLLEFDTATPAAVVVKHLTPCGTATANSIESAYQKAHEADSLSAFGGVVALNQEVSEGLAKKLVETFLEIVLAPSFSDEARQILAKKEKLRLLELGPIQKPEEEMDIRSVLGGFLVQDLNLHDLSKDELEVVTKKKPTAKQIEDMLFAWKVCKHVKSNAIVIVKNTISVGVCGGQTSRVDAAEMASKKAGKDAKGAVAASDAFFPFPDGVEVLAKAGVTAIIQPGGSRRDEEVIAACDKAGIVMVFSGVRAFLH